MSDTAADALRVLLAFQDEVIIAPVLQLSCAPVLQAWYKLESKAGVHDRCPHPARASSFALVSLH